MTKERLVFSGQSFNMNLKRELQQRHKMNSISLVKSPYIKYDTEVPRFVTFLEPKVRETGLTGR